MDEILKRFKQDSPEVNTPSPSISDPLDKEEVTRLAASPYEELAIPYIPSSENAQQMNPPLWADDAQGATSPSPDVVGSVRKSGGGGELFGAGVGALLGAGFGFMTGANPLLWAGIGAVIVGGIVAILRAIFSGDDDNFWLSQILSELTGFWPF
ncbi:hypothetical protein KSF_104180 [Reticulibacter mediterranei]|uniref:Uncharacterized protein n=1 Tax=Reticulibacter mediterranei TaxID=2778369 RepID=A0A8J3IXN0_9CHLR|nr:hypothetical protein [Reticulibacter mediterranei]GHP00371.1 hypothetical protein KSF_104180 [Reticulibacter mediterranei]